MEQIHQQILMDLQIGSLLGDRQAQQQLERLMTEGASRGLKGGFQKAQKNIENQFMSTFHKAANSGLMPAAKKLEATFEAGSRRILAAGENLRNINTQIERESDNAERQRLQRRASAVEANIAKEQRALNDRIQALDQSATRRADLLEAAEKRAARDWQTKVQDSAKDFGSVVQKGLSFDSFDPASMASGFGDAMQQRIGPRMAKMGGSMAKSGNAGVAGLGRVVGALGGAAAAIAGAAAAIGAIGAIFAAAYGQTKKLNKALLGAASGADMVANTESELSDVLGDLREASIGVASAFRMTAEEGTEMLGAFNQAGLTFNEMRSFVGGVTEDVDVFSSVAFSAATASKGLGIEISQVAEFANKMHRDLGMGLDSVNEGFGLIFSQAAKAGMSTRDFFTAVSEASSGMALYNFRLNDTVDLLLRMTDALGEEAAKSMMGAGGNYRQMGAQERRTSTMLRGTGNTRDILKADLDASAEDFGKQFSTLFGDGGPLAGYMKDGALDVEGLGENSEAMYRSLRQAVAQVDSAAAIQLDNMYGMQKGVQGGTGDVAHATALASRGAELALQMSGAANLGISGPMAEWGEQERMVFQSTTGVTGEQYDQMERLDRVLRAEFETLNAHSDPRVLGKTFEQSLAGGVFDDSRAMQAEALKGQSEMQRIATQTMRETRSVSQTLKNKIAGLLDNIWGATTGIMSFMGGGSSGRLDNMEASVEQQEILGALIDGFQDSIGDLQVDITKAKTMDEVQLLLAEIESHQSGLAIAQRDMASEKAKYRVLARGGEMGEAAAAGLEGTTGDYSPEDVWARIPDDALEKIYLNSDFQTAGAAGVEYHSSRDEGMRGAIYDRGYDTRTVSGGSGEMDMDYNVYTSGAHQRAEFLSMEGLGNKSDKMKAIAKQQAAIITSYMDEIGPEAVDNLMRESVEDARAGNAMPVVNRGLRLPGRGDTTTVDRLLSAGVKEDITVTDSETGEKVGLVNTSVQDLAKENKKQLEKVRKAIARMGGIAVNEKVGILSKELGMAAGTVRENMRSSTGLRNIRNEINALPVGSAERQNAEQAAIALGIKDGSISGMLGGVGKQFFTRMTGVDRAVVTPMHERDTMLSVKSLLGMGSVGGGGPVTNNIVIQGGDLGRVYAVLRRAFRESGVRGGGNSR